MSQVDKISEDFLKACIHCGLCLPACPTYQATARETESPRGRIHLIAKWQSRELDFSDRLAGHLDSCLGCLGCQTACPSGVNYEAILDSARPHLAEKRSPRQRAIMRFAFDHVLPNYRLLRVLAFLLRMYQSLAGRRSLAELSASLTKSTLYRPFTAMLERLGQWEKFVPAVKDPHIPLPRKLTPRIESDSARNALLFAGCVMDVFYNRVNHKSIKLMLRQGHSVEVPAQTCCGALAYHAGEVDIARRLARANIERFGESGDPVVVTSAGCGAMLKHYPHLFEETGEKDGSWKHRAREFASRIRDISEFLSESEFLPAGSATPNPPLKPFTYHAACHLAHAQGVRKEPLELLERIVEGSPDKHDLMRPLADAEHCCGSAGIYNLFNTELSLQVLEAKLDRIEATGARTVVTGNPGCLLQIEAGVESRGLDVEVVHLVDFLDRVWEET